jgi:hypothetical protein
MVDLYNVNDAVIALLKAVKGLGIETEPDRTWFQYQYPAGFLFSLWSKTCPNFPVKKGEAFRLSEYGWLVQEIIQDGSVFKITFLLDDEI